MNSFRKIGIVLGLLVVITSCGDKNSRNYQYMPNMYEPIGYEAYQGFDKELDSTRIKLFKGVSEAMKPVEGTISRGWMPYDFANTLEEKDLARLQASPLDSLQVEDNLAEGMQLYTIYCAICHGDKGNGQGWLVKQEKILGVPSYDDVARNVTVGSTYHTIYYGLNSMGSYASQMDIEEMWKVSEYVITLKEDLKK